MLALYALGSLGYRCERECLEALERLSTQQCRRVHLTQLGGGSGNGVTRGVNRGIGIRGRHTAKSDITSVLEIDIELMKMQSKKNGQETRELWWMERREERRDFWGREARGGFY